MVKRPNPYATRAPSLDLQAGYLVGGGLGFGCTEYFRRALAPLVLDGGAAAVAAAAPAPPGVGTALLLVAAVGGAVVSDLGVVPFEAGRKTWWQVATTIAAFRNNERNRRMSSTACRSRRGEVACRNHNRLLS